MDELGENGKPVEMVSGTKVRERPLNLSLIWENKSELLDIPFEPDRETLRLAAEQEAGKIIFTGKTQDGVEVKKTFVFFPENYWIDIKVKVTPAHTLIPLEGAGMSWVKKLDPEKDEESRFTFAGPAVFAEGELHEIKLKHLDEGNKAFTEEISWAGYEEKYFMSAFLPNQGGPISADIRKTDEDLIVINCFQKANSPSSAGTFSYGFYCGPKDIDILGSLDMGLEKAIDFGMFDIISKPLLYSLKYLNKFTHNYGWAIIILTVILKVVFFPLTHKGYKSMKALKDLQPQMTALRKW